MKNTPRLIIFGIVIGALFTLAPLFGLLGTVFGMARAFQAVGNSGISNPASLSHSVDIVMISTPIGLLICPIGIIILVISIYYYFKNPTAKQTTVVPTQAP